MAELLSLTAAKWQASGGTEGDTVQHNELAGFRQARTWAGTSHRASKTHARPQRCHLPSLQLTTLVGASLRLRQRLPDGPHSSSMKT